jgi:hypothetical protein
LKVLQLILFGSTDINPPSNNDEELNKSVFADLIAGKPMKVWDNVEQVGGSVYPALLTAPEYSGRVLGQSLTKTVRNRMCVAFTGNNPTFTKELRRRVILCRIDAKMEKPELRETEVFKVKDVEAYALENRAMYYRALLILVRHWLAEGMLCPASPKTLASYEGWSRVCGGILGAAGIGGFLSNRDKVEEYTSGGGDDDPVRELVECWLASTKIGEDFHSGVSREGMLCKSSGNGNGRVGLIDIAANNDLTLPVKLARHATDAFGYDPADFGRFIAKGVGRVFEVDGEKWSITKGEKGKHGITWSLARVSG